MESAVASNGATGEITFSITRRSQILTLFSIDMLVLQRDSQNDRISSRQKDRISPGEIATITTTRLIKNMTPGRLYVLQFRAETEIASRSFDRKQLRRLYYWCVGIGGQMTTHGVR